MSNKNTSHRTAGFNNSTVTTAAPMQTSNRNRTGLMLRILCLVFPFFLLFSCVPEPIDIQIDPPEAEIVVTSQLIPNRVMLLSLTRSFSALAIDVDQGDSVSNDFLSDLLVDRARVSIAFAGQTETLFNLGNGVYGSVNALQFPNEIYTLSVYDSTTEKTVTSQTPMLPFIGFDSLYPVIDRIDGDTSIHLNYTLTDPPGDNYYVINVVRRDNDTSNVGIDLNSFFSVGLNVVTQTRLISDKTFDTNTISEEFELFNISPEDSIVVTISNISPEYYSYLEAQNRAQGILSQVTQEPINRPTNVNGGLGFFNAHFPDFRFYDLKEW